jgi:hypothetical protein
MKKQSWEELAYYHLHSEQVRIYEQLVSIYSNSQKVNTEVLQISYKIFVASLNKIIDFFQKNDLEFEAGSSFKGTHIEFSYPIFAQLNAEYPQEMEIMYAAHCVFFEQFSVKLYGEIAQALPDEIVKKYQYKVSTM